MPWDTYTSAPSQETIDTFSNRGTAPQGWNWAAQYTGAGNENMGYGPNPISTGYQDYTNPYDVLRDQGGAGGWTSGGSNVGLGRFDPATGQVTNQTTARGSGWSPRDVATIAGMAAGGAALSGYGSVAEGIGGAGGGADIGAGAAGGGGAVFGGGAPVGYGAASGAAEPVATLGAGAGGVGATTGAPASAAAAPASGWASPQNLQLGASLLGAGLQTYGINQAANAQRDAANQATALQRGIYNDTVARNQPYVTGGANAFERMLSGLGITQSGPDPGNLLRQITPENVQSDPGYQWAQQQGEQGIARALAARGLAGSGRGLKEASRFNTGNATQYFDRAFNRNQAANQQNYNMLAGPAQMGQSSANQTAGYGAQFGAQAGNNLIGGADATAASNLARGNVWQSALNQGVSAYTRPPAQNRTGAPLFDPYTGERLG